MTRLLTRALVVLLLTALALPAAAETRAWLDRERIHLGETVTLNIESDAGAAPDYTPLRADFEISGRTSRRQFELVNGRASSRTLYGVALRPRREGIVTVPPLALGDERTEPLSLVVAPARRQASTGAGDDVFVESEADDPAPYVQQAVGWVVRLYSAVPLVSGQLEQDAPAGTTLRQVGDDAQYNRSVGGRRYNVIERRYLLIPERSGPLEIPAARFEGRGATGFFDDVLGRSGALQATAAPLTLEVAPVPESAPQPWLPLHELRLRYRSTPQDLHHGQAATLTVEAVADGASASQLPELQLPPIDGVQVFAEPAETDQRFVNGRPQVTVVRKFALVPTRAGPVRLEGLTWDWWDVGADAARTATLPPLEWSVEGGGPAAATAAPPATAAADPATTPAAKGSIGGTAPRADNRGWILAAAGFAALWLVTLLWALQRRAPARAAVVAPAAAATPVAADPAALRRALDTGDFGDVADALCALARPPARDLDEVQRRLADPVQVEAVAQMERARWGGGDGTAARRQLREAFADGPRWTVVEPPARSPLPPLYP